MFLDFICNFPVKEDLAKLLYASDIRNKVLGSKYWMLDVVVAPSISSESVTILSQRKERKLFSNESLADPKPFDSAWSIRPIRGGFLRQRPASYILDFEKIELKGSNFSEEIFGSLILAWAVSWSSNLGGNEVSFVKDLQLIGSGGGPATIIAANNALARIRKTGHSEKSSIFAADAFFPFIDVPKILIQAGCSYGLVPEGGKHEQAVRQYFQDHSISMCYIPEKYIEAEGVRMSIYNSLSLSFDKKALEIMTKNPTLTDRNMLVGEAINLMNTKKELKNIKVDIQKSNSEYADIISKIKLTREELLKANNELQEKTKADNSPDVKKMKEEREKLENEIRQKRKDLESGFRELKFIKDEMTKSSKGEGTEKIVDAASAVVASMNQKLQTTLTELNAVKKTLENERKQRKNST